MDKIKELRKTAEEHIQESKKSFKKLMTKQESSNTQEEDGKAKESTEQQRGTKRRRVCVHPHLVFFLRWCLSIIISNYKCPLLKGVLIISNQ